MTEREPPPSSSIVGTGASPALTERQLQILALVARGLTNRQVGEALGISEWTVRNHMRAVLRKLRSRDRTQAVVIAISAGWIAIPIDATGAPLASEARPSIEGRR